MLSIKERFFYFLFHPLVLDRILVDIDEALKHLLSVPPLVDTNFVYFGLEKLDRREIFLLRNEKGEPKCVRKIVFNASLPHSFRSFLPRLFDIHGEITVFIIYPYR